MDYEACGKQILQEIGGRENLVSAAHCATRLRLVIADSKKVSKEKLEAIDGVKGVFEASGQLQIIIGTGAVNKVFDEFVRAGGIEGVSEAEVKQAAAEKAPWYQRAIKTLGDVFVPIIPAIVASGLLMVSQFRYTSFKGSGSGPGSDRVPFFALLLVVAALIALWIDPPKTLLAVLGVYALSGPALWLWRLRGRRTDAG